MLSGLWSNAIDLCQLQTNRDGTARSPMRYTCSDLALERGVAHTHGWNECEKCDIFQKSNAVFFASLTHGDCAFFASIDYHCFCRTLSSPATVLMFRFIHAKLYHGSQRVGQFQTTPCTENSALWCLRLALRWISSVPASFSATTLTLFFPRPPLISVDSPSESCSGSGRMKVAI